MAQHGKKNLVLNQILVPCQVSIFSTCSGLFFSHSPKTCTSGVLKAGNLPVRCECVCLAVLAVQGVSLFTPEVIHFSTQGNKVHLRTKLCKVLRRIHDLK